MRLASSSFRHSEGLTKDAVFMVRFIGIAPYSFLQIYKYRQLEGLYEAKRQNLLWQINVM